MKAIGRIPASRSRVKTRRKALTVEKKAVLKTMAQNKCQMCFKVLPHTLLQVHHIVPLFWDGSNDPSNLMVVCQECHYEADLISEFLFGDVQRLASKFVHSRSMVTPRLQVSSAGKVLNIDRQYLKCRNCSDVCRLERMIDGLCKGCRMEIWGQTATFC